MADTLNPLRDPRLAAQAGMEALRRGDAVAARRIFEQLARSADADASVILALAIACHRCADRPTALETIDVGLAREPGHFQLLLLKADLLAEASDSRAAAAHYLAAVRSAAARPPAATLANEVNRAQQMCDQYANELESQVRLGLTALADKLPPPTTRVTEALDILFGRRQAFFQQPRYFYFPGLAQIPFFDVTQFAWVAGLESQTAAIRDELVSVMRDAGAFTPYVEGNQARPANLQNGMLNNPDWSAFYLWKNGNIVAENAARCPATMKALATIPLTQIPNRSPSVLFSLLKPGAHIPPHNGLINTRLIAHLPLIVPGQCSLRVGNETREWVEDKVWLFDDTIEHEAWNRSDQTRVILLFEVNRPDVGHDELAYVNQVFEAIDRHSGRPPEWEI